MSAKQDQVKVYGVGILTQDGTVQPFNLTEFVKHYNTSMNQGSIQVAVFTVNGEAISMDGYLGGLVVNTGVDKSVYVVVNNYTNKVSGYTDVGYMQPLLDAEMDSEGAVARPIIELAGLLCYLNSSAGTMAKDRALRCFNTSSVSQPFTGARAVDPSYAGFRHPNNPALWK